MTGRIPGHDGFLRPASASECWWARIIDGGIAIVVTAVVAVTAMLLHDADVLSIDAATALALLGYPAILLILGALYGCMLSPGQSLMGVVSLRTTDGRRVGLFRGMGRYLAVGLFPVAIVGVVWAFLGAPLWTSPPVQVYARA